MSRRMIRRMLTMMSVFCLCVVYLAFVQVEDEVEVSVMHEGRSVSGEMNNQEHDNHEKSGSTVRPQPAALKNENEPQLNAPDVQGGSRHRPRARSHLLSKGVDRETRVTDSVQKQPLSFNMSRAQVFNQRKDAVQQGCQEYITDQRCFWHAYGRILVDEAHKTLFCEIFKVGSSNWLRTFMGFVADVTPDFRKRIDKYYKHLNMCNKPGERAAILKDYTTRFMFVRHPFSRLVSCFVDKVDHDPDADFIQRHLKLIEDETGTRPATLTFSNFVDYIIHVSVNDSQIDKLDPHIKPMYRICCPCEVRYDYIGHLETQKDDSDFILKQMRVNVTFPGSDPIATNSSDVSKLTRYFSQLNSDQISGLYKIYMWDFKLFGYEFPEYLKSADMKI
ncbi:carbohydrate sulfotransferase 8-like [Ptychodera flava]|uniref:carbohydrate sulfotransferase 8-like n=1 Tax=Ptychodera flava TaxID=63121 RepID=UPI003969F553